MKFLILLVVLLSGCSVIDEYKDDRRAERSEATCLRLGHQKGTPEFMNCVTQIAAARSTRR